MVTGPIQIQKKWRTRWSDGPRWGFFCDLPSEQEAHKALDRLLAASCMLDTDLRIVDAANGRVLWEGRLRPRKILTVS